MPVVKAKSEVIESKTIKNNNSFYFGSILPGPLKLVNDNFNTLQINDNLNTLQIKSMIYDSASFDITSFIFY
jgi:hypothetical protein